jgi:hypothetical protein
MKRISKGLSRVLKSLADRILDNLLWFIMLSILPVAWLTLTDKWGWFLAYTRVLQDGYNSGYVRGTLFKTAQGFWGINWRLGGQPFIHVILPYVFASIFLLGLTSLFIYLVPKYCSFRRLKKVCTYLRHPKNFRKCISFGIVTTLLIVSLVGITGITIDPNIVVPAEPSKDYLEMTLHLSVEAQVTVIRGTIVEFDPPVIEEHNLTEFIYCTIKAPENSFWNSSDIDTSTIILNETISPCSTAVFLSSNGTPFILARFDKNSLLLLLENQDSIEHRQVTLNISGRLKNGDFFAGSQQVQIVY